MDWSVRRTAARINPDPGGKEPSQGLLGSCLGTFHTAPASSAIRARRFSLRRSMRVEKSRHSSSWRRDLRPDQAPPTACRTSVVAAARRAQERSASPPLRHEGNQPVRERDQGAGGAQVGRRASGPARRAFTSRDRWLSLCSSSAVIRTRLNPRSEMFAKCHRGFWRWATICRMPAIRRIGGRP